MSQHDLNLANDSGAAFRADLNAALVAIAEKSAGTGAPSTTYANQDWADTTNNVLRRRNAGNSAYTIRDTLDDTRAATKTGAYTIDLRDFGKLIMGNTASSDFTFTLPSVSSAGSGFCGVYKNTGGAGNSLTIDGAGAETINGTATITLQDGDMAIIWCDGAGWQAAIVTAASNSVPTGAVLGWNTSTPPAGYLECDGSAVSRITYANLFAVYGTTFGVGDGSTTFNLPDYRGEFLRGWSNGSGKDPDAGARTNRGDGTGGDVIGSKQASAVGSHSHNIDEWRSTGFDSTGGNNLVTADSDGSLNPNVAKGVLTYNSGGETRPRNVNTMWVVKY